jgi:hypothetical protein
MRLYYGKSNAKRNMFKFYYGKSNQVCAANIMGVLLFKYFISITW